MEWYVVVLIVFGLGSFVAWPVVTLAMRKREMRKEAAQSVQEEPVKTTATVKEKNCIEEKQAGQTVPYYQVTFTQKDGKYIRLETDKAVYDALQIGETGTLLMQGEVFLDFENRFGKEIG